MPDTPPTESEVDGGAPAAGPSPDWRLAGVVIALLVASLLVSARELLSPLLVTGLLIFVLFPYR